MKSIQGPTCGLPQVLSWPQRKAHSQILRWKANPCSWGRRSRQMEWLNVWPKIRFGTNAMESILHHSQNSKTHTWTYTHDWLHPKLGGKLMLRAQGLAILPLWLPSRLRRPRNDHKVMSSPARAHQRARQLECQRPREVDHRKDYMFVILNERYTWEAHICINRLDKFWTNLINEGMFPPELSTTSIPWG